MIVSSRLRRFADRASLKALKIGLVGSAVVAAVATVATASAYAIGYRVNLTPSMPVGVWQVAGDHAFERGDVVWACPPDTSALRHAHRYGYIPAGFCPSGMAPLLKPVVAIAGDVVTLTERGLVVNGQLVPNSAPLRQDGHGVPLPRIPFGSGVVRDGEVWLVSSYNPASFDSRYFGPVSAALVDGRARPVAVKDRL